MKKSAKLRFALDNISLNRKTAIISIFLLMICMLLVIVLYVSYEVLSVSYNDINNNLTNGIKKSGVISYISYSDNSDENIEFWNYLVGDSSINSIGTITCGGTYGLDNLYEAQLEINPSVRERTSDVPEMLYITDTLLNFCNFRISEGMKFEELELDKYCPIYLGADFKGKIDLGTEFKTESSILRVVGFLERGTKSAFSNPITSINSMDTSVAYEMDGGIIFVMQEPSSDSVFFSIPKNSNIESVIKDIKENAQKYNCIISAKSIEDLYMESKSDIEILRSYMLRLLIIASFSSVMMISCIHVTQIISNKKNIGIYYLNGLSIIDVRQILFIEISIKVIISSLLSIFLGSVITTRWLSLQMFSEAMLSLYWSSTSVIVAIAAIILSVTSYILPLLVLENYSPAELLGGKND